MSAPAHAATFQRLSWSDTMLGMPTGAPVRTPVTRRSGARGVLEEVLRAALEGPRPCYVLFSGGRDSSAILATAVHVARRDALPEPVPVTVRHPESPESDETAWQELVLRHLRVERHEVLHMHGEQSLLGDVALDAIRRRGPMWPAAVQVQGALYRHLDPGVVVSGEGGDMVINGHRAAAVRAMLEGPTRASLRDGLYAVRPTWWSRRAMTAALVQDNRAVPAWLRGHGRQLYTDAVVAMSTVPLRWDSATRLMGRTRPVTIGLANFEAAIIEYSCVPVSPFLVPEFVDALAHDAGPTGWGDRTAVFRRLVGDLLPDAVLSRTSKASFNSTRWGAAEREFAQSWDGVGFDDTWIDPEALRREWLSERPHPASSYLLQVAWAMNQGLPVAGGPR